MDGPELPDFPSAPARRTFGTVPCRACGNPVQREAEICKHCRVRLRAESRWHLWLLGACIVVAVPVYARVGLRVYALATQRTRIAAVSPPPRTATTPEAPAPQSTASLTPSTPPADAPPSPARPTDPALVEDLGVLEKPLSNPQQNLMPALVRITTSDGTGTGFYVDKDSHILTCAHVVKGESTVTLGSGGPYGTATVVARLEEADLALLERQIPDKIKTSYRPETMAWNRWLRLTDAASVHPGETVTAAGYPLGLDTPVLTRGVVSAAPIYLEGHASAFLQFDAAVNPGCSGGPVLNADGLVVGIVTAKILNAEGTSFATVSNYASSLPIPQAARLATSGFARWKDATGAERASSTLQIHEPKALEIERVVTDAGDVLIFVTVRDADGKPMTAPIDIAVKVESPGTSCMSSYEASADSFGRAAQEAARQHGVKLGAQEPVLAIRAGCPKASADKGAIKVEVRAAELEPARGSD
ncbi:MAG: trypsin-like peptidase domain-containing protein [Acidobacteriota bacterium]